MCVVPPKGESEVRSGVASELRSAIVMGRVDFYEDISGDATCHFHIRYYLQASWNRLIAGN